MISARSVRRLGIAVLAAAALIAAAADRPADARSKIAIIVNDTPITSNELAQRARLLQLITRKGAGYARSKAREELINEALQLEEAKRRGYKISNDRVERAFASIAVKSRLTPAKLSAILKRSGVNPTSLKERIRAQIAWSSVVKGRFQATVKVHEQDVISALLRKTEDVPKVTYQYELYQVVFIVPSKSPKSHRGRQRNAANSYYRQFRSCDTDLEKARGLTDVVVKKIGMRLESDIRAEQREQLKDLGVGQLTKPENLPSGFQMLAVCGKTELQSDIAARSIVEDELREQQGEILARRYLRDLRRNAVIIEK